MIETLQRKLIILSNDANAIYQLGILGVLYAPGCLQHQGLQENQGKIREMHLCLKILGKNQGISLALETISEMSGKLFFSMLL